MTVDEIVKLMEGMAKTGMSVLEHEGLKLGRASERGPAMSPASGIGLPAQAPVQPQPQPVPAVTPQDAMKAVQKARMEARANAEARLDAAQARTAKARRRAASGIGASPAKLANDVFETAMSTPAIPRTSALDTNKT